ncbi:MAG: HPr family phosphocarrier protein [Sulfurovum sp.]
MKFLKNIFAKSQSTEFSVTSSSGFHLRPIAQFVALAKTFSCKVTATFNNQTVDAKKVNNLLSLSLEKGDTFTLNTKGDKAEDALYKLHSLLSELMQQDKEIKQIEKVSDIYIGERVEGEIISQGVVIASTYPYTTTEVQKKNSLCFNDAIKYALEELNSLSRTKNQNANIYLAQKELLFDVSENSTNLVSFEKYIERESDKLIGFIHESKIGDYKDIHLRVKKHLGFKIHLTFPDRPFILLANDLMPSEIDILIKTKVVGVILQETSIYSHSAILLRATGIPSIIANISLIEDNQQIILDTHSGVIITTPNDTDLERAKSIISQSKKKKEISTYKRFDNVSTKEGRRVKVFANVEDVISAKIAKEEGAEGIGLLRSEFLFKNKKPSIEEQKSAYIEIFNLFDDITIRTLDVGGDKSLPYLYIPVENNPFLGIRGVRLFRTHPDILAEQLYSIFLASNNKPIKIMFPMVSRVEEFIETKKFALEVANSNGIDISHILFGIMVEVPSVLFLLSEFNEVVDFYSIGTNDLSQYLFATERTHSILKIETNSPVIFSAISMIRNGVTKPLSICGELASDFKAIPKLIDIGIETLSVSPKRIAQTKEEIRDV